MIYSSHAHVRVPLGELSMHFNVEAKGKRLLVHCHEGKPMAISAAVRHVRSRSCCNYYGPFDCVRDDVLRAANCWLTLRDWRRPWLIKVPCGMAVLVQVGSSARET